MRESPNVSGESLRSCLQEQYAIAPVTIQYLEGGLDFSGRVYRVSSEQGADYMVKVKSGTLYAPGCTVPRYLRDQGIASVVAPIPTLSQALWTTLDEWNVIVYPFIEGVSTFTGMTDAQWKLTGEIFRQIHDVPFSPGQFESIREETFDPIPYIRWITSFETGQLRQLHTASGPARAIFDSWMKHRATIDAMVTSIKRLGATLRRQTLPYVICHADLHPANLLRDRAGQVHVIDWDDVMLAPKERDFIFVWEPDANAFWDGYGGRDVDQAALAYYNWERVVTDLIAYASDTCFRGGLSEETRAGLAESFEKNLSGQNLAAARVAEAKLAE